MNQYIQETAFATKELLGLVSAEENKLKDEVEGFKSLGARIKGLRWEFESSDLNDDFPVGYSVNAFNRMSRAEEAAPSDRKTKQARIDTLQVSIDSHEQAVQVIAGAILQIAQQGISTVYSIVNGELSMVPEGRKIGSLAIKEIIWRARNQAMHYEAVTPNKLVAELFKALASEQGPKFSLTAHPRQSRARQVLELLDWKVYADYEKDMATLLP